MENICALAEFPPMAFPASLRTWTIRAHTARTNVSAYKTSTTAWTSITNSSSLWARSRVEVGPFAMKGEGMPAPQHDTITVRRSELACPAHSLKMMAKAAASDADEVVFDLEDGCAPSQKIAARKTLIEAFSTLDFRGKIRAFRPNGVDTRFFYRDVIEVVEAAGGKIDVMVVPKVHEAADVLFADRLLTQIEQNIGLPVGRIRLEVLIESAKGVLHAEQIAASAPRLAGLIFGVVDYAGSIGARDTVREQFALYHYPKARTVAAARAAGIDVVDGGTLQFRDLKQCEHDARPAAQMGV